MQRNKKINHAHNLLSNPSRFEVIALVESVNLTLQEKKIILESELNGKRISEIAEDLNLSPDSIMRIKTKAMNKIHDFAIKNH